MVYPLPPGQGDAINERRREVQQWLDELDLLIKEIDARLRGLDGGSSADVGEAERLSAKRHRLVEEAVGYLAELDYLDDPEEFQKDVGMLPGDGDDGDADYDPEG